MLTIPPTQPALDAQESIAVIGIGGAGTHILNNLQPKAPEGLKLISVNADARLIKDSLAEASLPLGAALTRGLSCGGDPDLGKRAAESGLQELESCLQSARLVFLTVGLGGGTGSGAAPVIARKIRETGAFLVIFATLPFSFEGERRNKQAAEALSEMALYANILLTFENDRMGELIAAEQGVLEAFSAADTLVSESIAALSRLTLKPGLIHLGLDDVATVLGTHMGRCLFGFGSASGGDRAGVALRKAFDCPLISTGESLGKAPHVLAHISGGKDLSLAEIQTLMGSLKERLAPESHIHFGVSIDDKLNDSLHLFLLAGNTTGKPRADFSRVHIIEDPNLGADSDSLPDFEPTPEPLAEQEPPAFHPAPLPEQMPHAPLPSRSRPETVAQPETIEPVLPQKTVREETAPHRPEPARLIEEELSFPAFDSILERDHAMAGERNKEPFEDRRRPSAEEQAKMPFASTAKGKFAGDQGDLIDGEDLDLPPALRRRK